MAKKYIELFAGYGGGSFAIKRLDQDVCHECIAYSEIDKNAIKTYDANHKSLYGNLGNIANVDFRKYGKMDIDLVMGGSPCQDFSMAGYREGVTGKSKRSALIYEYIRAISEICPKHFILENVGGMLSSKDANGMQIADAIIETFAKIGYYVEMRLIHGWEVGHPQNRPRIIFVGSLFTGKNIFKFQQIEHKFQKLPSATKLQKIILCDEKWLLTKKQELQIMARYANNIKATTGIFDDDTLSHDDKKKVLYDYLVARATSQAKRIGMPAMKGGKLCVSPWSNFASWYTSPTMTCSCSGTYSLGGRFYIASNGTDWYRMSTEEAFLMMGISDKEIVFPCDVSMTAKYQMAGNGWLVDMFIPILEQLDV